MSSSAGNSGLAAMIYLVSTDPLSSARGGSWFVGGRAARQDTSTNRRRDWVRFVEALQIAVASFCRGTGARHEWRQLARHGFEEPVAPGIGPVSGIILPGFARMPWLRFAARFGSFGGSRGVTDCHWVRFAAALEIGFVSSRRYRLPWLRFVKGPRPPRTATACPARVRRTRGTRNWPWRVECPDLSNCQGASGRGSGPAIGTIGGDRNLRPGLFPGRRFSP